MMERLTDKNIGKASFDTWELCGLDHECKRDCWKPTPCKIPKMVYALAAYEDTNLTPAEITDLARAKEEGRWIPVTERLPEHSGLVLAYYNCGTCDVSFIHNRKWYGDCDDGRVTHWMSLPELPKEAAEAERNEDMS
jgi:hypothetical protein